MGFGVVFWCIAGLKRGCTANGICNIRGSLALIMVGSSDEM